MCDAKSCYKCTVLPIVKEKRLIIAFLENTIATRNQPTLQQLLYKIFHVEELRFADLHCLEQYGFTTFEILSLSRTVPPF